MRRLLWLSLVLLAFFYGSAQAEPFLCGTYSGTVITRPQNVFGKFRIHLNFPSPIGGDDGTGPYHGTIYWANPVHCPNEPYFGGVTTITSMTITASHLLAGRKALCVWQSSVGSCATNNLDNTGAAHLNDCTVTLLPFVKDDCPPGLLGIDEFITLAFHADRGGQKVTTGCVNNNNTLVWTPEPDSIYGGGKFTNATCNAPF